MTLLTSLARERLTDHPATDLSLSPRAGLAVAVGTPGPGHTWGTFLELERRTGISSPALSIRALQADPAGNSQPR